MKQTQSSLIGSFQVQDAQGITCTVTHKLQEIEFDDPQSKNYFHPVGPDGFKPFVVTKAADKTFGSSLIALCHWHLVRLAMQKDGLDYFQVFDVSGHAESLWFVEDDKGGAITALLPSEY